MNQTYTALFSEADFHSAVDSVLRHAERELLVFDRDLTILRFEDMSRIAFLADFLFRSPENTIRIVVHDPDATQRFAPRLMQLITRFSKAIACRQSPDNLRQLADSHVIADEAYGVRRFHVDQPRSALILGNSPYLQPWRQRFEELWQLSSPCFSATTTGL